MKLFLDSAHIHEIKHGLEMWRIDGITTNPKHVQASGQPFEKVVEEIGSLIAGTDKTVSVEVNPHLDDYRAMVSEASRLAGLCPNFVIKLPATEAKTALNTNTCTLYFAVFTPMVLAASSLP